MNGPTQLPLFNPESDWRPPSLSDLPSWRGAKRVGLDTEDRDETLRELGPGVRRPGSYMVGVSFAIEHGPGFYLPFAHEGGDNLPRENVIAYLKDQCKEFDGDIVGANLSYDLDWLWDAGVEMPMVHRFLDVQNADPLINELHIKYSLDAILGRFNLAGKDEELLREAARMYHCDPKVDLWRLPARFVGPYAEWDARGPLEVLRRQERHLEEDGLLDCFDMECKLLPILVRMRRRGVHVDLDRLEKVEAWSRAAEGESLAQIKHETGVEIPVGQVMNAKLLERALEQAGVPIDMLADTTKGKSISKASFHGLHDLSDKAQVVVDAITRARKVNKIRTTFAASMRRHMTNGRIHCGFNQMRKTDDDTDETKGVAYGRLSSDHPNMQQQPGRDEETGPMWRCVFRPEEDEEWVAEDLKQQEPKWSFHYGAIMEENGVRGVTGAIDLCKRFIADPNIDTYIPLVEATGVKRGEAKILWLARAYGNGDASLCEALGLETRMVVYDRSIWKPIPCDSERGQELLTQGAFTWRGAGEEGQKIIDMFDGSMPFLKRSAKLAEKRAKENGYVKLISGRRCHFEQGDNGEYQWTHKAFNRIIQGTAAEQMKQIMIAVSEAGFDRHLLLQIHDELDFSLPNRQLSKDIAHVMANTVPMKMPTVVDVEIGASWGESMGVEIKQDDGSKIKRPYEWRL